MHTLTVTISNPSSARLAKIYILLRDLVEFFGLADDVEVKLNGIQG